MPSPSRPQPKCLSRCSAIALSRNLTPPRIVRRSRILRYECGSRAAVVSITGSSAGMNQKSPSSTRVTGTRPASGAKQNPRYPCAARVESFVEPVAGTRERPPPPPPPPHQPRPQRPAAPPPAALQQQPRSEALETTLRAAQQLHPPPPDIGLDEIEAIEAKPFRHAVDCRHRHDLLRHCLPVLRWLSQMGKAEPEAAPVLQ